MLTLLILDLIGTFFFAVSGSLLAARRGFDVVGSLMLGSLTGLGGGVIRDLILGVTPNAFAHPVYFLPPLLAVIAVYFFAPNVDAYAGTLTVFDAGGLALFCIVGTIKALELGMHPVSAVLLGMTTAVGGGLLRDVVANQVPTLFDPRDIYAVPALLGSGLTAVFWQLGFLSGWVQLGIAAVVFTLRVLAVRFAWHVPRAVGPWHQKWAPRP